MQPSSLARSISPPPTRKQSKSLLKAPESAVEHDTGDINAETNPPVELLDGAPTLAAVEAGQAQIQDHLDYFAKHLGNTARQQPGPRLDIEDFQNLYKRNQHSQGCHFVIHQHDHPISGVHYDLRLQFSESSAISFAVPYGMPGNANSIRPNRMAIETRVHNLWNNLIESASHATGSLLIWDTGEYEVLPRPQKQHRLTDDELSDAEEPTDQRPQNERLATAFQSRHIHLRLHGTRLPPNYTLALRLPSTHTFKPPPRKPSRKRRRLDPGKAAALAKQKAMPVSSDTEDENPANSDPASRSPQADWDAALASEDDDDDETTAALIRATNAYPGATNTINSIHQRHWFLTLDRSSSGFHKARSGPEKGRWVGGWAGEPFFVRGRDVERSVVTGRNADEVMRDEGVERFVGRKMWRAILE